MGHELTGWASSELSEIKVGDAPMNRTGREPTTVAGQLIQWKLRKMCRGIALNWQTQLSDGEVKISGRNGYIIHVEQTTKQIARKIQNVVPSPPAMPTTRWMESATEGCGAESQRNFRPIRFERVTAVCPRYHWYPPATSLEGLRQYREFLLPDHRAASLKMG